MIGEVAILVLYVGYGSRKVLLMLEEVVDRGLKFIGLHEAIG